MNFWKSPKVWRIFGYSRCPQSRWRIPTAAQGIKKLRDLSRTIVTKANFETAIESEIGLQVDAGGAHELADRKLPMRDLIDQYLSRRTFVRVLSGGFCTAALVDMQNEGALAAADVASSTGKPSSENLFQFQGIPTSMADEVVVPNGYVAEVLYRWGDPIDGLAPRFKPDASNTADEQEKQAGMGHDGMEFFSIPGKIPTNTDCWPSIMSTPIKYCFSRMVSLRCHLKRCL